MTPEEITVRYRWTFEALKEANRWRSREQGWHRIRWVVWFLVAAGISLAAAAGLVGRYDLCAWGAYAALVPLLLYYGGSRGIASQLRRQYDASPRREEEIQWQFTEPVIRIHDPHGSAELAWDAFIKCVRTPEGMMFYTHPRIFHWLPREAFATEAEYESVADAARRRLAACQELR